MMQIFSSLQSQARQKYSIKIQERLQAVSIWESKKYQIPIQLNKDQGELFKQADVLFPGSLISNQIRGINFH